MEKKTMGSFIAVLRKANGLTQQDLADRLNVSNKAVSRWERDECAPDIGLIVPIAEIFGITTDELLKGERIIAKDNQCVTEENIEQKMEQKSEKQLISIVNRTIYQFKILMYVAIGLALIGLVAMYGIKCGFNKSVLAFSVMLMFEIGAAVLAVIVMTKIKDMHGGELFERCSTDVKNQIQSVYCKYVFECFYVVLSAVIMSLQLIIIKPGSMYRRGLFSEYTHIDALVVGLITALILRVVSEKPFKRFLLGTKPYFEIYPGRKLLFAINAVQLALVVLLHIVVISMTIGYKKFMFININDTSVTVVSAIFVLTCAAFIVLANVRNQTKFNAYVSLVRNIILLIIGIVYRLNIVKESSGYIKSYYIPSIMLYAILILCISECIFRYRHKKKEA